MAAATQASVRLRAALMSHTDEVESVLRRYAASNPRVFGSVARGDATKASDLDLLVDLDADAGNDLLRVAGIAEELSDLLDVKVDVVAEPLLRDEIAALIGERVADARANPLDGQSWEDARRELRERYGA